MSTLTLNRHISAPPERVFTLTTDVEAFPKVVPGIKKTELLTPGPVGRGTRFRETREMFGKEATETMEFVEFSPPTGYTIGCTSCGVEYRTSFDLRAAPAGGTDLVMTMDCRPVTLFAKVVSPVMGLMMKGTMRKLLEADLDAVKRAAETA